MCDKSALKAAARLRGVDSGLDGIQLEQFIEASIEIAEELGGLPRTIWVVAEQIGSGIHKSVEEMIADIEEESPLWV